jgi:hypothetical protein
VGISDDRQAAFSRVATGARSSRNATDRNAAATAAATAARCAVVYKRLIGFILRFAASPAALI